MFYGCSSQLQVIIDLSKNQKIKDEIPNK